MKGHPMDWNKILNWKLLSGSHKFPGPDGGTCINEAAIVAAGFKYHAVSSAADCPPCFSRVLSAYAIAPPLYPYRDSAYCCRTAD